MEYNDLKTWSKGISPGNHYKIYEPIHEVAYFEGWDIEREYRVVIPKVEAKEKVSKIYWGFERAIIKSIPLVQVTEENYLDLIFRSMEELAKIDLNALD